MILTNYDFYDIYWCIVLLRSEFQNGINRDYNHNVIKAIKNTIEAGQKNEIVEINSIRSVLSEIEELHNTDKWNWIHTKNVYTYGVRFIKDDLSYQILSACLDELLCCLTAPNTEQLCDLTDALHNVPIILADQKKHIKKRITREISYYRKKWNKTFLKNLI